MKFLTDENIAVSIVRALRDNGFDVKDVKEEKFHGSTDLEILAIANKEERIIITHDKDFAYLATLATRTHKGIILLRVRKHVHPSERLLATLQGPLHKKIPGNLVIVSETHVTIHSQ